MNNDSRKQALGLDARAKAPTVLAEEVKDYFRKASVKEVGTMLACLGAVELSANMKNTLIRLAEERLFQIRRGGE